MSIQCDKCYVQHGMGGGVKCSRERLRVSGEVWEGFMKKSLLNRTVKGKQGFSGVGGTFQINI